MDPFAASIMERCTAPAFKTLGALTRSAPGVAQRAIVRSRSRRGTTIFPFLSNVQGMHYYVPPGEIFPIDLAVQGKRALFFQREPKVIVHRMIEGNRFRAGYVEDRMAFGREFFILTSRSLDLGAMFLLGLLGSRLYPFLYQNHFSITYAGEPKKVTLRELRKLPVPIGRRVERGLINGLVMRILNAKSKAADADTSRLEREIDRLVYRIFGISDEEVVQVESGLTRHRQLFETLRPLPAISEGRNADAGTITDPVPDQ